MALVVDLRYRKLKLAIGKARSELANFQAAQPTETHWINALHHISDALSLVNTLLKEHRDKKV